MALDKQFIQSVLREATLAHIQFKKKDGTLRTMVCTVDPTMIPQDKWPRTPWTSEPPTVPENLPLSVEGAVRVLAADEILAAGSRSPDVARVFDVQKGEWRSFRYDSVLAAGPIED